MKIVVFSDSHSDVETMAAAVRAEKPDAIFHLGDHSRDAAALCGLFVDIPLYAVKGNTDWDNLFPEEQSLELCGRRLLLVHGHRQDVKSGTERMFVYAEEKGFEAVFFGHTHVPFEQSKNGVTLYNPGRVGRRSSHEISATYGVLTVGKSGIYWVLKRM